MANQKKKKNYISCFPKGVIPSHKDNKILEYGCEMRNHSVRRLPTNECITWVLNEECSIEGPSTTNHIVHKNYIQFTEFLAHEALNTEELEPS